MTSKYHIILIMNCSLNLEQKELCRVRVKLLTYLDRLATYEVRLPSTITPTPMYLTLYHVQEPPPTPIGLRYCCEQSLLATSS